MVVVLVVVVVAAAAPVSVTDIPAQGLHAVPECETGKKTRQTRPSLGLVLRAGGAKQTLLASHGPSGVR
ncbi:hypothetical protein E2C01_071175 [Portunus trituberculatus]|uniref:Secreted protein n=1 Tax=Portunus trituberculatus TaxID=210409 RepID=A0A5B7I5J7_PORTR|nr:hypothetical protein [Portunus trituberculatus]